MKMLVKNRLREPIRVLPGNHVAVTHVHNGCSRTVADIKITAADTFNTAFIATLEPGDMGFARGYIGGIAQEEA